MTEAGKILIPLALPFLLAPQQTTQKLNDLGAIEIRDLKETIKANEAIADQLENLPLDALGIEGLSFKTASLTQLEGLKKKALHSISLWKQIAPEAYERSLAEGRLHEEILKDLQAEIERTKRRNEQ